MEHFYRHMRRSHGVLMDGDQPCGERWNFDHENRKPWNDEPPEFYLPEEDDEDDGLDTPDVDYAVECDQMRRRGSNGAAY